nr:hypothetical protein BdHM001_35430 [Bdellovibrio sp. HM001]
MKTKLLAISLLSSLMIACSGGGGGSSVSDGGGNGGQTSSLSWSQSTVTANTSYMKDGQPLIITVSPRGTNGQPYDIAGEWNIQLIPLCVSCVMKPLQTLTINDFVRDGDNYVATINPEDSSAVSFMLSFVKYENGATPGDTIVNQAKLSLIQWEICAESKQQGELFVQTELNGEMYNVVCTENELKSLVWSGKTELMSENFMIAKDIIISSGTVFFGVMDNESNYVPFTGNLYGNGKTISGRFQVSETGTGATISSLTVSGSDMFVVYNSVGTVIDDVTVENPGSADASKIFLCNGSTTILNSPSISCHAN